MVLAILILVAVPLQIYLNDEQTIIYRSQRQQIALRNYEANLATYNGVKIIFAYGLAVIVLVGLATAIRIIYVRLGDRRYLAHLAELQATQAMTVAYYDANKQPQHAIGTLTYSPTVSYPTSPKALSETITETTLVPSSSLQMALPSLTEILKSSPLNTLCYGFNTTGQAHYVPLKQLSSLGVGGLSGSGKTSTLVFLLAQLTTNLNAQLIVLDPHGEHDDSLLAKLRPLSSNIIASATTSRDTLKALDTWQDLFEQRKTGNTISYPVILVTDEYLAMMRDATVKEKLTSIAESLAQEGRKYNFYGYFASQKWLSGRVGDLKDTLSSHLIHRMPTSLAHYQTNLSTSELPTDVHSLEQGSFYLLDTTGNITHLRCPYVDTNELMALPNATKALSATVEPVAISSPVSLIPVMPQIELTDREQLIYDKFRDGMNVSDIIRDVYKVDGGKAYQTRSSEIQGLLRRLVSR